MDIFNRLNYKLTIKLTTLLLLPGLFFISTINAEEIDWKTVDATEVMTFYPGVASWDYLQDERHGTGGNPVKEGKKSCAKCHVNKKGEYDIAADRIISGDLTVPNSEALLEPTPRAGMEGYLTLNAQAAFDAENIYIKLSWPSAGTSFTDAAVAEEGLADRVSIQFADDQIKNFADYGCYITCHSDLKDMPDNKGEDKKLYAEFSIKNDKPLPQKMLDLYLKKNRVIDQWVASFHGSKVVSDDEYILDSRIEDKNDLEASGSYANGEYSVIFKRKLNTGETGDIALKAGDTVHMSIAIHEAKADSRKHYTSFPLSLGLGSTADLAAKKL